MKYVLAGVSALFGAMMFAIAPDDDRAIFFYGFGLFCLAIAVLCFARGRFAYVVASFIAACVLAATFGYVIDSGIDFLESKRGSGGRLMLSLCCLATFGLGAFRVLWSTQFGFGFKSRRQMREEIRARRQQQSG